ncbi:hypothetical protein BS47DRAFT_170206 [Hydnum rufescens UP504]|uniref:Uncharacterized protein n=1 Tax=Hydnum rufescens UP504 TaxID=1448309 RepID=A0A9P6DXX2_9AGAM|nr:hypothetical protein BS47DRAFT_170206 [Hydnum rufescens UP504]
MLRSAYHYMVYPKSHCSFLVASLSFWGKSLTTGRAFSLFFRSSRARLSRIHIDEVILGDSYPTCLAAASSSNDIMSDPRPSP